jgi:hypothetical protein
MWVGVLIGLISFAAPWEFFMKNSKTNIEFNREIVGIGLTLLIVGFVATSV